VTIDGRVAELGNRVKTEENIICVDGTLAAHRTKHGYFLSTNPTAS